MATRVVSRRRSQPTLPREATRSARTIPQPHQPISPQKDSLATRVVAALFQDTNANAIAAGRTGVHASAYYHPIVFTHYMAAGTTSATVFKVNVGDATPHTITMNGAGGARDLGGVLRSSITITEIRV